MRNPILTENTQNWRAKEVQARRAIEDHGFVVHDANIIFRQNCPNIDLVVYAQTRAFYVQVKSSKKPAGANSVIIDGSPWTREQLYDGAPIFNKHDHLRCELVVILDTLKTGETHFYIAPPKELEKLVRPRARKLAKRPKRDDSERSIAFRKELPRALLMQWAAANPPRSGTVSKSQTITDCPGMIAHSDADKKYSQAETIFPVARRSATSGSRLRGAQHREVQPLPPRPAVGVTVHDRGQLS